MKPRIPLITPLTAEMSPERCEEYVTQSREELAWLGRQGYHAADWALEAIGALSGNLHRAHLTIEQFASRIAPGPISSNRGPTERWSRTMRPTRIPRGSMHPARCFRRGRACSGSS